MMEKLKLLIIAPYEGLKGLIESVLQERQDIEADIYTVSLEDSIKLLSDIDVSAYDAVISRGTTGKMLQKAINRRVIDIETTILDIIRAMQLTQSTLTQYVFVGFPKFINQVKLYCELMRINAEAYSIDSVEDARQTIKNLQDRGSMFIIGDGIAVDIAKSLGMGHILVTSGVESINMAIDNAVTYCHAAKRNLTKSRLLDAAFDLLKQTVVIFDDEQKIFYVEDCDNCAHALIKKFQAQIPLIQKQGKRCFYETVEDADFRVSGKVCCVSEKNYIVFCASRAVRKPAANKEPYVAEVFSESKLNNNLSLYNSSEAMTSILKNLKNCAACSLPILISGEPGCGKDTLAYTAYALGPNRDGLFFTIDCSSLNKQNWQRLINNEDSPLYENGNSIYFKEVSALSASFQKELCDFIQCTGLIARNQIIASVCQLPERRAENGIIYPLYKLLGEISLNIPPLRERIKELPSIAVCYINEINQQLPKQITGFEEEALNLLKNFEWPYNIDQLKQVVKELIILTNTPYISAADVRHILDRLRNKAEVSISEGAPKLDLNRPLAEIERDIINIVMYKNGTNQTMAAKQLGLSRSTLWRKLKE